MTRWMLVFCFVAVAGPAAASPHGGGHGPATGLVLSGSHEAYHPTTQFELKGIEFQANALIGLRLEGKNAFAVDRNGTELTADPALNMQTRIGISVNTARVLAPANLALVYEHDVLTGGITGKPEIEGMDLPDSHGLEHQLRQLYLRASLGKFLHVSGGFMTNQWGLGLLANDGSHGWAPGNAHFADPRGGDRVLRVMLATGPLSSLGVVVALGYDWVQDDDVLLSGDSARQFVGAVRIGEGRHTGLGFYGAYRVQEGSDGTDLDVGVLDMYLRTAHELAGLKLSFEVEAALVTGSTTFAASADNPEKDVFQLGLAARASLSAENIGGVLDIHYASGDADFDDHQQTGFKADPNYELSILLYRHVLAAHTGRAVYMAGDRSLVGRRPAGLERYPTRESSTNTVALFPRVWWRPLRGLEVYGGPLFAFTAVPMSDPFNAKLGGGTAKNALNGTPGSYLGTELDLGARFQMIIWGTELTVGAELGVFFPGSALDNADRETMDTVVGGRGLIGYRF